MRIGADTSFFLKVIDRNPVARRYWDEILAGRSILILSVLSVHEMLFHFYKRGESKASEEWLSLLHELGNVQILPVTEELARRSAGYRHGMGIPTVDSLILATCVVAQCELVLSSDSHFGPAGKQGVILLNALVD